jgi:hypothetical protein
MSGILLNIAALSQSVSIAPESINASSDLLLITSVPHSSIKSSSDSNFLPNSSLVAIILLIGPSHIHLIALRPKRTLSSSIYVKCFNDSSTLGGRTSIPLN